MPRTRAIAALTPSGTRDSRRPAAGAGSSTPGGVGAAQPRELPPALTRPARPAVIAAGPATVARAVALALLLGGAVPPAARAQYVDENLWATNGAVRAMACAGRLIYLGGEFTRVGPATGGGAVLDTGTALPLKPYPNVIGHVRAVVADGAGGWYIGGDFTHVRGQPRSNLAHLDAAGNLTAWNPGATGPVHALLLRGGVLYVAGEFLYAGGQSRSRIAALSVTTGQATTWNPAANGTVLTLAANPNTGHVYAGGEFTWIGGASRSRIAEIDPTTGTASGWNPNASSTVSALAVRAQVFPPLVTVYAGGMFTSIGGQSRAYIAALDANPLSTGGATSWNPGANSHVFTLLLSGSVLYAGGSFTSIGGSERQKIAAVSLGTGAATSWNPGADVTVRMLAMGGGRLYVGGHFGRIGGEFRSHLAAVDPATGAVAAWNPHPGIPPAAENTIFAIAVRGDAVFAGGPFVIVGGVARERLAALDRGTGAATPWNPAANSTVLSLLHHRGRIYAGGRFSTVAGASRSHLAEIDSVTGIATAWSPNPNGEVRALALRADAFGTMLYVGGAFTIAASLLRSHLAAFLVSGSGAGPLAAWAPAANSSVNALALTASGDAVVAGGWFTSLAGVPSARIGAVNAITGEWQGWSSGVNGPVHALAASGGRIFAGGEFSAIVWGGPTTVTRNRLSAFHAEGGAHTSWNPDANGKVNALAAHGGTVYAGGDFSVIGSQARDRIAALDATTGTPQANWAPAISHEVSALAIADGLVYAGGSFSGVASRAQYGLTGFAHAVVGVGEAAPALAPPPLRVAPNPFRTETSVRFALAAAADVEVVAHDLAGRLVRRLHRGPLAPGEQRLVWDGRDEHGHPAAAGIYFLRVRGAGVPLAARVLRLE